MYLSTDEGMALQDTEFLGDKPKNVEPPGVSAGDTTEYPVWFYVIK